MAATLTVQNTAAQAFGTTANCSLAGVASGDMLAVCLRERDGAAPTSVASDVDGALTQAVAYYPGGAHALIYYLKNVSSGTHVVTVTFAANRVFNFNASAWGGCETTGGADATQTGTETSTSHACTSVTPSASSLMLQCSAGASNYGSLTAGSGYTALTASGSRDFWQYKAAHTGATTGPWTSGNSVESINVIAAFLESGGGGGGAANWGPLLAMRHNRRVQAA